MTDYTTVFETYREEVELDLQLFLDPENRIESRLREAMAYSLLAGGKRIRPILLLSTFDNLQVISDERSAARKLAAAMEMIHTYSLIHDDLPSMDDDDLRRGQPTNHRKFDEATAILAGDALLNRAYELILEAALEGGAAVVEAGSLIAGFAGARGMIGGQIIDLSSQGQEITLERLEELQRLKTGALLRAAVGSAGLLAASQEPVRALLDDYGLALGLVFQIKDDILDVTSTSGTMGKTVGKDERDTKVTFVTMLGIDAARERLALELKKAETACENLAIRGIDSRFLSWLAVWLGGRKF